MVIWRKAWAMAPLVAWLLMPAALAQPLPEADDRVHEGVASCASTVCHGRVNADDDAAVWLNEYRVWLRQDYHSRAYRTLLTEQSQTMAKKLGLPAAHTADLCLDCHADNVPAQRRGARFQIDDGVGCEACHGGAGDWLESHAELGTSHADNIRRGLYPTDRPGARAELCLSCHLGTRDKFATHRIMGAGHPRLSFELETFSVNQPAHYSVDADYIERKSQPDRVSMWLSGLAMNSATLLDLLASNAYPGNALFPELAFFQCHACHHGMDDLRWQRDARAPALPPGSVRLNDGPLTVLLAALEVLDAGRAEDIASRLKALHAAAESDPAGLRETAARMSSELSEISQTMADRRFDPAAQRTLRLALLKKSAEDGFAYFTAAEQAFLAVETLSIALGDSEALAPRLDALFEALGSETSYVPDQYAVRARQMLEAI
ncbi:MAG: multiheme c-type cytochrome [Chromatocurvus sp.]